MNQETKVFFQIENDECAFKYKMKCLYPGYTDSAQSYDEMKLVHIVEGSGIWNIGGKDYAVTKDDVIMLSRLDERHMVEITSAEALVTEQVEFLPMTIHPMQNCANFFFERPDSCSNVFPRDNTQHEYLLKCFADMRNELTDDKLYQKEYIVHLLMGMVIAAARLCDVPQENAPAKNDSRYSIVCQTMVYIKNHLNEDLAREILAKKHGVSPSYLSRLFKEYSGICLQDYIVQCRVQKAIFLLKTGQYGVLEAALESGFTSSSGFYRAFHKVTGKKPKEMLVPKDL